MTMLLYSISFVPIMLIALVVHEFGHLAAARIFQVKVSSFQIGAGWQMAALYTGSTVIRLDLNTSIINPESPPLRVGDLASAYVVQDPDGEYRAVGILPRNGPRLEKAKWDNLRGYNRRYAQLTGRIREMNQDEIRMADMAWRLKSIPLIAGVTLPEDPQGRIGNLYSNAPWPVKMMITLAGPSSNILMMFITIILLAMFPITMTSTILMISGVAPGTPAESAGLRPNDRIIQVNSQRNPGREHIREAANRAAADGKPITLRVVRGQQEMGFTMNPDPGTGRIGVFLEADTTAVRRDHSLRPGAIASRFYHLSQAYVDSVRDLAISVRESGKNDTPLVSGPIQGAYETARAVEYAGPKAWLVVLATFNLGIAFLNMLPIPPLDGFRMTLEGIQALRHNRPINPELERIIMLTGAALIWIAGICLIITDILRLLR